MSELNHDIYQRADPKEADALAWVFSSKDTFEKYYFKLPILRENEVRARVLYTSLCMSDSLHGRSKWGSCYYPICTGHEVIGEVITVGEKVEGIKAGDKVAFGPFRDSCGKCKWCLKGWTHACDNIKVEEKVLYGLYFGGYATHIQQPARLCFKLKDDLPLETSAPLLCAGITVYLPLALYLEKGGKVAVYGIGGLGHLAIQYASKMGSEVHAFTSSKDKAPLLKELGASKVILWDDFYASEVNKEYDVILNTIPGWADDVKVKKWLDSLNPYGKMIILGMSDVHEDMKMDVRTLVFNHNAVIGSCVGGRKHTEDMLDFSVQHNIQCKCEFFEFEDFPKALERMEHGKPQFRCVVKAEKMAKELEKNWKK